MRTIRAVMRLAPMLLSLACSHAESKPADPAPAPAAVAAATPSPAAVADAAATSGAPAEGAAPAASPLAHKMKDLPGAGPRLPSKPGTGASLVQGCLTAATEEEGRSFPSFAPTRSGPDGADLDVTPVEGGVLVTHRLSHACCLQGSVATQAKGDLVTITETLSGNACRCMCGSTLKTAVRLAPGRYRVAVAVAHEDAPYQGKVQRLPERVVEVR